MDDMLLEESRKAARVMQWELDRKRSRAEPLENGPKRVRPTLQLGKDAVLPKHVPCVSQLGCAVVPRTCFVTSDLSYKHSP